MHDQVNKSVAKFSKLEDGALIVELYLVAFSRVPTAGERAAATEHLAESADRGAAIRDLVWAVLNTQEFIFQH